MTDPREALRPDLSPIKVPRWVFLVKYAAFTAFGFYAAIAGTPTFDLSTPEGYRPIWAAFVVATAFATFVSCLFGWWRVEQWTVLAMTSFMLAYVYSLAIRAWADGDSRAQAITVLTVAVMVLPVGRFLTLARRSARLARSAPPAPPEAEEQEGPEQ